MPARGETENQTIVVQDQAVRPSRSRPDTLSAWMRVLDAQKLVLTDEQVAAAVGPTDTYPMEVGPVGSPRTEVVIDRDQSVITPTQELPNAAVLVDEIDTKVKTPEGYQLVTTTRAERHAEQVRVAERRLAGYVNNFKLQRRANLAEKGLTSNGFGVPKLQEGQAYAKIPVGDVDLPAGHPLDHIVARRGTGSQVFLSGRMNPSRVRRHGAQR